MPPARSRPNCGPGWPGRQRCAWSSQRRRARATCWLRWWPSRASTGAASPPSTWTSISGSPPDAPERFGSWLGRYIFDRSAVRARCIASLPGDDPEATAREYADLLAAAPIDLVQLGIGVNGHIAFNDPPVADFDDPLDVKVVELDRGLPAAAGRRRLLRRHSPMCRCSAITLTMPRLLRADRLFCMVPGAAKRNAVRAALEGPVDHGLPGLDPARAPRLHALPRRGVRSQMPEAIDADALCRGYFDDVTALMRRILDEERDAIDRAAVAACRPDRRRPAGPCLWAGRPFQPGRRRRSSSAPAG